MCMAISLLGTQCTFAVGPQPDQAVHNNTYRHAYEPMQSAAIADSVTRKRLLLSILLGRLYASGTLVLTLVNWGQLQQSSCTLRRGHHMTTTW